MNAVKAAFLFLIVHLHATGHCAMPNVVWNSRFIDTACQAQASPINVALACYDVKRQVIYLPDGWDQFNHDDEKLLYHEMDRHIEQACLGHVFTEAEPLSVLEAEYYAP